MPYQLPLTECDAIEEVGPFTKKIVTVFGFGDGFLTILHKIGSFPKIRLCSETG